MTVYNINLGIGWASSGVEYAQAYRAKIFREMGLAALPLRTFQLADLRRCAAASAAAAYIVIQQCKSRRCRRRDHVFFRTHRLSRPSAAGGQRSRPIAGRVVEAVRR